MPLVLSQRAWVLAERLFIHCHGVEEFRDLLQQYQIDYSSEVYDTFGIVKGKYTFMSEENYEFATFMEAVPTYRYLPLLERIVFDKLIPETQNDNWNYYGEYIRSWYPDLLALLRLAGIQIDPAAKRLRYEEATEDVSRDEFLPEAFGDPFLDYIRKETNAAFAAGLYLSVMFTSRKILETIVVRLFEVVFPKLVNKTYSQANHELWYDKRHNTFRDLETLLSNLRANAAAFDEDRDLVIEFVDLAKPLKNETNASVHRDYHTPDEHYVRSWKIPNTLRLGRKLFRKYCNP